MYPILYAWALTDTPSFISTCVCMHLHWLTDLPGAEEDRDGGVQERRVVDAPAEDCPLHRVGHAGERPVWNVYIYYISQPSILYVHILRFFVFVLPSQRRKRPVLACGPHGARIEHEAAEQPRRPGKVVVALF